MSAPGKDPNIGRRLRCHYGWYKVLARCGDLLRRYYRVELVSGPDDGTAMYRDAGWVTRDRKAIDRE